LKVEEKRKITTADTEGTEEERKKTVGKEDTEKENKWMNVRGSLWCENAPGSEGGRYTGWV
jgi:hypothetical protein